MSRHGAINAMAAPAVRVTKLAAMDWGSLGQKLLDIHVAVEDSKTAPGKVGAERHAIVLLDRSGSMLGSAFVVSFKVCSLSVTVSLKLDVPALEQGKPVFHSGTLKLLLDPRD